MNDKFNRFSPYAQYIISSNEKREEWKNASPQVKETAKALLNQYVKEHKFECSTDILVNMIYDLCDRIDELENKISNL